MLACCVETYDTLAERVCSPRVVRGTHFWPSEWPHNLFVSISQPVILLWPLVPLLGFLSGRAWLPVTDKDEASCISVLKIQHSENLLQKFWLLCIELLNPPLFSSALLQEMGALIFSCFSTPRIYPDIMLLPKSICRDKVYPVPHNSLTGFHGTKGIYH